MYVEQVPNGERVKEKRVTITRPDNNLHSYSTFSFFFFLRLKNAYLLSKTTVFALSVYITIIEKPIFTL